MGTGTGGLDPPHFDVVHFEGAPREGPPRAGEVAGPQRVVQPQPPVHIGRARRAPGNACVGTERGTAGLTATPPSHLVQHCEGGAAPLFTATWWCLPVSSKWYSGPSGLKGGHFFTFTNRISPYFSNEPVTLGPGNRSCQPLALKMAQHQKIWPSSQKRLSEGPEPSQ